ncbi:hypothetical protein [Kocuria sp. CPCC 205263]|uniref:hypothetical protein n=1 Tax=Kocuria sp. CPCC 205263 TaxID=3073555 RepID=UPI0034D51953
MLITALEAIRTRGEGLNGRFLVKALASTRPGPATGAVTTATGHALRRLARRHQYLTVEITELEDDLRVLVGRAALAMIARRGYGVITTATLLVTAGANPERL